MCLSSGAVGGVVWGSAYSPAAAAGYRAGRPAAGRLQADTGQAAVAV